MKNIPKEAQLKFVVTYSTAKLIFFTNTKEPVMKLSSSVVVYHSRCSLCHHDYIRKTEKNFGKGLMNITTVTKTERFPAILLLIEKVSIINFW